MKLCAVFNAWSDCIDLLEKSVDNILPVVDEVVIVWSHRSNRGQVIPFIFAHPSPKVHLFQCEPDPDWQPNKNEVNRRNVGLDHARMLGCTHFLMMDCDEFYVRDDVEREKLRMERDDLNGLVCGLRVYIKEPTLWCEDHTRVPFIQKLTEKVRLGDFRCPFSRDEQGDHIDPTRRPNHTRGVEWSDVIMHHFSYVRKDMDLKIRNSSANLERSRRVIMEEMAQARPGWMSLLYHKELKQCEDIFKIKGPEYKTPAPVYPDKPTTES